MTGYVLRFKGSDDYLRMASGRRCVFPTRSDAMRAIRNARRAKVALLIEVVCLL